MRLKRYKKLTENDWLSLEKTNFDDIDDIDEIIKNKDLIDVSLSSIETKEKYMKFLKKENIKPKKVKLIINELELEEQIVMNYDNIFLGIILASYISIYLVVVGIFALSEKHLLITLIITFIPLFLFGVWRAKQQTQITSLKLFFERFLVKLE